ncbi:NAD(P)-binding domain superfamily protein [Pleurotus pulmonarius]
MAILVTGGGGMTSRAVASQLKDTGIPFVIGSTRGASASSPGIEAVKFDWTDKSTYPNPFQHVFPGGEKITAVYLVPGPLHAGDPNPAINAFVDYAMTEHGVKRFVLCGGVVLKKGGPWHLDDVWSHFKEVGAEYMVLRPTWFLENYLDWFLLPLKNENRIYTCAGDTTLAFISIEDIASLAIKGLTSDELFNCDFTVHGPELVTHDQLAEKFSKILGRKIEHVKLTEEERAAMLTEAGFPSAFSKFGAYLEANIWDREIDDATARVIGKKLITCDEFIEKHESVWL